MPNIYVMIQSNQFIGIDIYIFRHNQKQGKNQLASLRMEVEHKERLGELNQIEWVENQEEQSRSLMI